MGGIPGGTPLTPAEREVQEQWASLRRIVEEALRFMPGGPGQGEGPLPSDVDRVVETLLFLYRITGRGQPLFDWLGIAFRVDPAVAEVEAAMAVRDIILMLQESDELEPGSDDDDTEEAERAAERFATVPDEATR
jgi:hypothetical protein